MGGGGGVGGDANLGTIPGAPAWFSIGAGVGSPSQGGSAGDGGPVNVEVGGNVSTEGTSAVGVLAQSVGGGGGLSGTGAFVVSGQTTGGSFFAGGIGGNGSGGVVQVTQTGGTISTTGDGAHGIFAQSIGGKQDSTHAGTGGNVTVSVSGTVKATGVDANGIMAQSEGLGGNGTVKITVDAGAVVQGGTGNGRSILVLDGNANNTIVNSGTVGSSASLTAVETGDPADRIRNSGVIVGSVDLGKGRNRFVNRGRGMFLPGETVDLGRNGRLTNRGTVVLGAVAGGHRLAGDFVQREKGVLRLVLDGSHDADEPLVHVQGRVRLAGEIDPVVPDTGSSCSRARVPLRLLRARRGLGEDDLRRLTIKDEENASYAIERDGDEIVLRYELEGDDEPRWRGPRRQPGGGGGGAGGPERLGRARPAAPGCRSPGPTPRPTSWSG